MLMLTLGDPNPERHQVILVRNDLGYDAPAATEGGARVGVLDHRRRSGNSALVGHRVGRDRNRDRPGSGRDPTGSALPEA